MQPRLLSGAACWNQSGYGAQQLHQPVDVCFAFGFGEGEQQAILESRVVLLQWQAWNDLGTGEFRGDVLVWNW